MTVESKPARTALELDELLVPDAAGWRAWLEQHHEESPGVWLVLHKKGGAVTSLRYPEAVEEALCFGWIDGQARRRDDESSSLRFTPRHPRSMWSVSNVEQVARLERDGRMREAGRAAVAAAKADGRWDRAYVGKPPPVHAQEPASEATSTTRLVDDGD
jgi:uncharacterized protein YdeI (YjbR/CyaY-like superfamily)